MGYTKSHFTFFKWHIRVQVGCNQQSARLIEKSFFFGNTYFVRFARKKTGRNPVKAVIL